MDFTSASPYTFMTWCLWTGKALCCTLPSCDTLVSQVGPLFGPLVQLNLLDLNSVISFRPTLHNVCIISFSCFRYYRANSVRFHHSTEGCDASCEHTHYCAITRLDYPEFRSCLETAASALASAGVIALSIHWSLLILPLVVLVHAAAWSVLIPSLKSLCNSW